MANVSSVKHPKRTVDLGDGVEREVILSLNAMAELEEKYGSIEEAFEKVKQGSVAAIRFLLWCVLVPDGDKDLTEREIGRMIRLDSLNDIVEALTDAFEEQMPNDEDVNPNTKTPAAKVIELPNSTW